MASILCSMKMWNADNSAALEAQVDVAFPKGSKGAGDPWGALTISRGHLRVGLLLDSLQTTWLAGSQGHHCTSEPLFSIQGASPTCPGAAGPPFSLPEALSLPAPRGTQVS